MAKTTRRGRHQRSRDDDLQFRNAARNAKHSQDLDARALLSTATIGDETMNILYVRLRPECANPQLKYETSFAADDKTKLVMLANGHFVVSKFGKNILVPHPQVLSAEVEPNEAKGK